MTTLQTERLDIRNFRPEDWRDLHEMIVQYQASEYAQYDDRWPTSEQELQGIAKWFSEGDSYLAVCQRATGKLIGLVAQNMVERDDGPAPNLGYIFNFDYHSQGYATEACRATIDHIFEHTSASKIVTGTATANEPSCRLLKRLGLRESAKTPGEFTITRDEWLALRQPPTRV